MDTLLINRQQIKSLLGIDECMNAVENAFKLRALGEVGPPGILGVHAKDGGFHIKAGLLKLGQSFFVAKVNANFPSNTQKFGLPTIQGIITVSDAENGRLLALMDSMEITIIRTGAATGVAAKYLSRPDSKVALICGCGNQGRISLLTLLRVRKLAKVYVFDMDPSRAQSFANEMNSTGCEVLAGENFQRCALESDIIVTCTPSTKYFVKQEDIQPGTFIAAVGSDSETKQELDPQLIGSCKLVVDSLEQCATIGELHHALEAGTMAREGVHAELGELIAGKKPGRTLAGEIIVFDSTGTGLQDVAAAAIVYGRAIGAKCSKFDFGS